MLKNQHETSLILNNIRSAQNVGAIFRTADACGVDHIYLIGYTPLPIDRFNKPQKEITKTALGAELTIPWSHHKTITPVLKKLKQQSTDIIALEQAPNSVDYKKIKTKNFALILGNEVDGISPSVLKQVDIIAEIAMHGKKESLNVSVACGIALFRLMNI